jgi:hypothetical protein
MVMSRRVLMGYLVYYIFLVSSLSSVKNGWVTARLSKGWIIYRGASANVGLSAVLSYTIWREIDGAGRGQEWVSRNI